MTNTEKLNIEMTAAIKGVALLLMLVHHLWGFPDWRLETISYPTTVLGQDYVLLLRESTKICVSMFAFLTGWAYFYKKEKNLKYSVRKIAKFLYQYWLILFLIFIPAAYFCSGKVFPLQVIIINLFALDQRIVTFSWYVYFYILCMLSLPYWVRLFH